MIINQLVLGLYENNCYVLRKDSDSQDCVIIDTGLDVEPLIDFIDKEELRPVALLCTHGHADHIAGIPQLRESFPDIEIVIHKNDQNMVTKPELNLSMMANIKMSAAPAETIIEKEQAMSYAGLDFKVIETPGHTQGGVCFYFDEHNIVFVGDTLFAGSVGRTDFPGYDQQKCFDQLIESVNTKLFTLPENTKVYPGHGPFTSIRNEKKHNPYFANV